MINAPYAGKRASFTSGPETFGISQRDWEMPPSLLRLSEFSQTIDAIATGSPRVSTLQQSGSIGLHVEHVAQTVPGVIRADWDGELKVVHLRVASAEDADAVLMNVHRAIKREFGEKAGRMITLHVC